MPSPTPSELRAQLQKGLGFHQSGAIDQAAVVYRQILATNPDYFDALHLLGVAYMQMGQLDQAESFIRAALAIDERQPAAQSNLGTVLLSAKKPAAALACYERAIDIHPSDVEAHYNRGTALRELGRSIEALDAWAMALKLNPQHAAALVSRATLYRDLGRIEEALVDIDAAVVHAPTLPLAHYNRGCVLKDLNRTTEAEACYRQAIVLKSDFAEAHVGLAEVLLLTDQEKEGWAEYEWRWRTVGLAPLVRRFAQPQWQGQVNIKGKTILLYAEQGFGDTVMCYRYAKALSAAGVSVVLEAQPELTSLFKGQAGDVRICAHGDALPAFDVYCPLMSLPLAMAAAGLLVGSPSPYLQPSAEKLNQWRTKLGPTTKRRIGLAWSGRATHANDQNRSIALAQLAPLFNLDADFFVLQKDLRINDIATLAGLPALRQLGTDFVDFSDVAAVVALMDNVISVDTIAAHLAGALGKPVSILLPFAPDWRWGLEKTTTQWYPTAKLLRQTVRGKWDDVIARATQL